MNIAYKMLDIVEKHLSINKKILENIIMIRKNKPRHYTNINVQSQKRH